MKKDKLNRREFCGHLGVGASLLLPSILLARRKRVRLRYVVSSSMYGKAGLAQVLPEVRQAGAEYLDLWCKPFTGHREEVDAMGLENFAGLLQKNNVRLGVITRYDLGPQALQAETDVAKKLGAEVIISGSPKAGKLQGEELKSAIRKFVEELKPPAAAAAENAVTIAIENHGDLLMSSEDALKWFCDFAPSKGLGIALALLHLGPDPAPMARLIKELRQRTVFLYAWQRPAWLGKKKPSLTEELDQLPGRGPMDFTPVVAALKKINYGGFVSNFMHSSHEQTMAGVTEEIIQARQYLDGCLAKV